MPTKETAPQIEATGILATRYKGAQIEASRVHAWSHEEKRVLCSKRWTEQEIAGDFGPLSEVTCPKCREQLLRLGLIPKTTRTTLPRK